MTIKLIGAACIALAAGKTLRTIFVQRRREDALLRHMAAALTTMGREIRWHHRPIPAILQELKQDEMVGEYFAELVALLNSKNTLQYAWNSVFNSFWCNFVKFNSALSVWIKPKNICNMPQKNMSIN